MLSRRFLFVSLGFALLILAMMLLRLFSLKTVSLSEIQAKIPEQLITVQTSDRLEVYRTSDGVKHAFMGERGYAFASAKDLLVWEKTPSTFTTPTLFSVNEKKVRTQPFDGLPGVVDTIDVSPSGMLLLVQGTKPAFACVVFRQASNPGRECTPVENLLRTARERATSSTIADIPKSPVRVLGWYSKKANTLVLASSAEGAPSTTYLYEVIDIKSTPMIQNESLEKPRALLLERWGIFTRVASAKSPEKRQWFILWPSTTVLPLSEDAFLLMDDTKIQMVHVQTRVRAVLVKDGIFRGVREIASAVASSVRPSHVQ